TQASPPQRSGFLLIQLAVVVIVLLPNASVHSTPSSRPEPSLWTRALHLRDAVRRAPMGRGVIAQGAALGGGGGGCVFSGSPERAAWGAALPISPLQGSGGTRSPAAYPGRCPGLLTRAPSGLPDSLSILELVGVNRRRRLLQAPLRVPRQELEAQL